MTRRLVSLRSALVVLGLALAAPAAAQTTTGIGFVRVAPADVKWVADPSAPGVERATIMGDPAKPGIYVVRIKFPRGLMSLPHYHAEDRHATVLQGTWYTGVGDRFDPSATVGIGPGSYMMHPAGEVHFDGAKDEDVIVQIVGYGPSTTVRLQPELGNFGPSLGTGPR